MCLSHVVPVYDGISRLCQNMSHSVATVEERPGRDSALKYRLPRHDRPTNARVGRCTHPLSSGMSHFYDHGQNLEVNFPWCFPS